MSGGSKKTTTGYRYYMGLHMGLCAGPIDALQAIKVGDRQAWTGNVTASGAITIDAPTLFGGEDKEGGVAGTLDVMMGEASQTANAYLTSRQGGVQPAYRGLLGVVFRQGLVSMNNPYVKPWAFKVRRILKGWQSDAPWYSAKAAIVLPGGVGQAMNPAHIVYECLTNADWGMGYGSSLIDDANFRAAADVFHAEGMGLCLLWAQQSTIEAFVQTVLDHAGANLAQDPRTGLFKLTAMRGGYDVNTLPVFDESNVLVLESFERAATPEAVNEITVTFRDLETGKDTPVTVHNLANVTSQGGVVAQPKSYPGLPTAELAIRVALRDLRVVSSPLAKVRMRVTRDGYTLLPGGLLRLNWPKLGVSGLVLRVLRVGYGSPTDAQIEIEAAEDVFGLGSTAYAQQQPVGWTDPNNDPAPAANRVVTEAPLYELNRALSSSELAALSGDEGYLFVAAGKPTGDAQGFEIRTRPGTSGAFEQAAAGDFAPTGTLTAAIGPGDTAATLTNLIDSDLIVAGRYALIGTEVVRVDTFNAGTGAITFGRGVLDTVATAHGLGAVMYFADPYDNTDGIERVDGDTLQVKLLPSTGRGQLTEASAPTDTVVFDQRPFRPYPPGRLRIGGVAYPLAVTVAPVFTWAHRDRTQQNLEGDESTNIGPEPGVTYSIEVRNAGTNALLGAQAGMTGTSYTLTPTPPGVFNMRVLLWSIRAGLESRQRHDYTFAYSAPAIVDGKTFALQSEIVVGFASNGNGNAPGDLTPIDPRFPSLRTKMLRGAAYSETPDSILLLMHADGANGSTSFTDSSTFAHAVTAVGAAVVQTGDKKYGTGSANLPGTLAFPPPAYLRVGAVGATPAALQGLMTADFTIEGWAKLPNPNTVTANSKVLFCLAKSSGLGNFEGVEMGFSGDSGSPRTRYDFFMNIGSSPYVFHGATAAPHGEWFHFAFVRNAGNLRVYVNGVNTAAMSVFGPFSGLFDYYPIGSPSIANDATVLIGAGRTNAYDAFEGAVDEIRVTKFARYTSDFTPPAGAFPNP